MLWRLLVKKEGFKERVVVGRSNNNRGVVVRVVGSSSRKDNRSRGSSRIEIRRGSSNRTDNKRGSRSSSRNNSSRSRKNSSKKGRSNSRGSSRINSRGRDSSSSL